MIIKIDGVDGCGKSTLVNNLSKILTAKYGFNVVTSAEFGTEHDLPWDSAMNVSGVLKALARNDSFGFDDVEKELIWALISRRHNRLVLEKIGKSGADVIIVDRSDLANFAYTTEGAGMREVFKLVTQPTEVKDLVIWLDTPVDTCIQRMKLKEPDFVEARGHSFFERIQLQYNQLWEERSYVERVCGRGEISDVESKVLLAIEERMGWASAQCQ